MKLKGILTDCVTDKESEIELEYEIRTGDDGRKVFQLLNGVTGYENFYIEPSDFRMFPEGDPLNKLFSNGLDELKKHGWLACAGTKGRWDKLFISASEMEKVILE